MDYQEKHPTIKTWIKDLKRLEHDAQRLVIEHHIYKEVKSIIIKSPVARQGSSFHPWLDLMYSQAACVKIRRMSDKDPRSYSLRLLLQQVLDQSHIITRERHRRIWRASYPSWAKQELNEIADNDFGRLCGKRAKKLWPSVVRRDILSLERSVTPIATYVDKEIAHLEKKWNPKPPTYGQFEKSIRNIERLILKYSLLLIGNAPDTLLPVWQYNWKQIFSGAWLPPMIRNSF